MKHWVITPPFVSFQPRFMCKLISVKQLWPSKLKIIYIINNSEYGKRPATKALFLILHDSRLILVRIQWDELGAGLGCVRQFDEGSFWIGHINIMAQRMWVRTENPVHWAITWVERKKRKLVWRFVTIRSLSFRKGVGLCTAKECKKRTGCWDVFFSPNPLCSEQLKINVSTDTKLKDYF